MAQYEPSLSPITVDEAVEILHSYGWGIGRELICAGIRNGVFPWAVCIEYGQCNYTVFPAALMRWIAERCGEEAVPEMPRED